MSENAPALLEGLEFFEPQTEFVEFHGGRFKVRAISLPDVAILVDVHEYAINIIVEKVRKQKELIEAEGDEDVIRELFVSLITELIRESPMLVANLIAICADARHAVDKAEKLPINLQLDALTKIAKLTFTDIASIKKLWTDVMTMVQGILPALNTTPVKRKK